MGLHTGQWAAEGCQLRRAKRHLAFFLCSCTQGSERGASKEVTAVERMEVRLWG